MFSRAVRISRAAPVVRAAPRAPASSFIARRTVTTNAASAQVDKSAVPSSDDEPFHVTLSDESFETYELDPPSYTLEVTKKQLKQMYSDMVTIRQMEMAADRLYKEKKIRGFCHLSTGQEAVAVGIEHAINKDDDIITAYRCHGFAYMRGGTVRSIIGELLGRREGIAYGKGGSMHMFTKGFYGGNGIVGAQVPVGAGLAFAHKYNDTKRASVVLYGDGASNQGQVFEAFNMAKLWNLPALFGCENNKYGMGTSAARSSALTDYYKRGQYIPGLKVNGMDVLAVKAAVQYGKQWTDEGNGPMVLEYVTYRYGGHSMSDPGTTYRTREEIQRMRSTNDPIAGLKQHILDWGVAQEDELKTLDKQARAHVNEEVAIAEAMAPPEPTQKILFEDIYVKGSEPPFIRGRTFFGQATNNNGSAKQLKPAPQQQTKLSFATKAAAAAPKKPAAAEDALGVVTKEEGVKEEEEVTSKSARNNKKSVQDKPAEKSPKDKKRPREDTKKPAGKEEVEEKVKEEEEGVDEEDAPPARKRLRRGGGGRRRVMEEEEEEEDEDEVMSRASPKKAAPKKSPPPPKKAAPKEDAPVVVVKEESRDDEASSTASASDVEDAALEDEDEKPEIAEKARKLVQEKLVKSTTKTAYPDWKPGEPVPYAALCTTFSLIELTTKRLIIMEYCSLFLRQVLRLTPDDLLPTVLLMINKLAPDYAGIELGIGESLIMKAIGETTGRSLAVIKQDQKEIGDLGLVAVKSRSTQPTMFKPKALTIRGVLKGLMDIATVTGNGAQGRKVDGIKKLLSAADAHSKTTGKVDITKDKGGPSEAKYLVRFLEGKLRLGLAERTVLVSLAQAMVAYEAEKKGKVPSTSDIEKAEQILKTVYSELPSYDVIIPAMVEHGIMNLRDHCKLRPGVPLKPMLAKPTKAITEVLDRFEGQTFTCEYKYDGERAQIHYVAKDADEGMSELSLAASEVKKDVSGRGVAAIFSRNSEDLSKKYPDILAKLATWVKEDTKSFVLDCESVAWDVTEKKVLPFQQLMTRKKKDVKVEDVKVKVCVFAFDLLYLNGEAIVEKSLRERRELLKQSFQPVEGEFAFATSMDGQELDEIQHFLDESVKASCEGLMVKMLDGAESGYEPSKRSRNWLKIKKDYLSGIGDSLDLVVLGAYYGKGKRTSVYGAFLLACYNPSSETYETVCNIGTGFSEAVLEELHKSLSEIVIDRPKPFYAHSGGGQHQPDVWFEPRYVWEVKTADLTLSPRYKAGQKEGVDPSGESKGISLRFPRFIKVRDDKKPDEATTSRQVAEMYRKQESVNKSKGPAVDDDFEY
ncbi:DNA ligase 1 [Diplogelasinospora grovesii]|uniref:Multifunctional fusion protein n=1 Tax=Diplogelasinospora grovesii TaxID=303347 RepID=A0AAN6S7W2_9PEZI|nr:DNA ligase 1 [Diplogelasinospora grovesii]